MAYVFNKGTAREPNWHGRYKDASDKWRMIHIPDVRTESKAQKWIDAYQDDIDDGKPDPRDSKTFAVLADDWRKTLRNRDTVNDDSRLDLHLLPFFGDMKVSAINQHVILDFIDHMRRTPKQRGKGMLSESTIDKILGLLSRFLNWCVPRHLSSNPIGNISTEKRPHSSGQLRGELPWLETDKDARDIYHALPEPYALLFLIGNCSGARLGELCGLRLSSFDNVDRVQIGDEWTGGYVTLRWTYNGGFLKEDKKREGMSKNAPIPDDVAALVKALIERRKAEGARPDSLLFPNAKNKGKAFKPTAVDRAWVKACEAIGFTKDHKDDADLPEEKRRQVPRCTFYEGTRHSFISRMLRDTRGRALYEIARAVGHKDTSMIAKHYGRWIVKDFSDEMRRGLGVEVDQSASITPLRSVG